MPRYKSIAVARFAGVQGDVLANELEAALVNARVQDKPVYRLVARSGELRHPGGDLRSLAPAAKSLKATYSIPYIQHVPLEPRTALAEWADGKLTVWTGTQNPFGNRGELMQAFRLKEDAVHVVAHDFGGGYGGKHTGEAAVEAAAALPLAVLGSAGSLVLGPPAVVTTAAAAGRGAGPTAVALSVTVVAGAFTPPLTVLVRTLWRMRLSDPALRQTAFATDAVALELAYTVGPALIALAVALGPPGAPLALALAFTASAVQTTLTATQTGGAATGTSNGFKVDP